MRRRRRVLAAILIAAMCAPGTWLRTPVSERPPNHITLEQVQDASETEAPGWSVAGVWAYEGDTLMFGGYSALVPLDDARLLAFSDRGARFAFAEPDMPDAPAPKGDAVATQMAETRHARALWDIEGGTRDPEPGTYWLSYENTHAIQRFTAENEADGLVLLDREALGWTANTGAEAMVRLSDGRFIVMPEGRRTGLIFASDPVETKAYTTFPYLPPIPGHAATDLAQLPDGRVLLLLRNLDWGQGGIPPFESKIAIADPPVKGGKQVWKPQITLDLAGVIPRENYEGVAVREMADGRVAVWLISDNNLAAIQRTLLAKLIFDPKAAER